MKNPEEGEVDELWFVVFGGGCSFPISFYLMQPPEAKAKTNLYVKDLGTRQTI